MINGMFWFFMNCIGSILKFVIVFGIIGFFLMLPFLLKGGWVLGIMYIFWISVTGIVVIDRYFQGKEKNRDENRK